MEHEKFPVAGFEFMDDPATDEQKEIIKQMARDKGMELTDNWPVPFSKWDAYSMIEALKDDNTSPTNNNNS